MNSFPSSSHLDLLRKGQQSLNAARPLIDTAEACGVDCTQYRQGVASLNDRIDTYIRRFFPDQIIPIDGTGVQRGE
jgi:hypothetical protein